jgi:poly-gamma-glutamate capsule biosynthesis protein CapA/YwtB (metallophosphatase superfamily)
MFRTTGWARVGSDAGAAAVIGAGLVLLEPIEVGS